MPTQVLLLRELNPFSSYDSQWSLWLCMAACCTKKKVLPDMKLENNGRTSTHVAGYKWEVLAQF